MDPEPVTSYMDPEYLISDMLKMTDFGYPKWSNSMTPKCSKSGVPGTHQKWYHFWSRNMVPVLDPLF